MEGPAWSLSSVTWSKSRGRDAPDHLILTRPPGRLLSASLGGSAQRLSLPLGHSSPLFPGGLCPRASGAFVVSHFITTDPRAFQGPGSRDAAMNRVSLAVPFGGDSGVLQSQAVVLVEGDAHAKQLSAPQWPLGLSGVPVLPSTFKCADARSWLAGVVGPTSRSRASHASPTAAPWGHEPCPRAVCLKLREVPALPSHSLV